MVQVRCGVQRAEAGLVGLQMQVSRLGLESARVVRRVRKASVGEWVGRMDTSTDEAAW